MTRKDFFETLKDAFHSRPCLVDQRRCWVPGSWSWSLPVMEPGRRGQRRRLGRGGRKVERRGRPAPPRAGTRIRGRLCRGSLPGCVGTDCQSLSSTSLDGILTSDTCEAALLGTGMGMEKVGQLGHIWYVCCLITKSSLDAAITEELAPGLGTCLKQSMKYLLMTTHV